MDGSVLISCSEDGSICIWEVKDYVNNIDSRSTYFDDILVNWSELSKLNDKIIKTETMVNKLEAESAYTVDEFKKSKEQELEHKKILNTENYVDFIEKNNKVIHV